MSEHKDSPVKSELETFDALIAGLKINQQRQRDAGQTPAPTPKIDRYIEKKLEKTK